MKNDHNIGIIGLGNIGAKIANNILTPNNNLYVFDLKKSNANKLIKNGAIWSKDIKSMFLNANIIITCLPSPSAVSKVVKHFSNFTHKKHLWIEMSTTDQQDMINLSKIINNKGGQVLESPLTGGAHQCETGNISIFCSGEKKVFRRAMPILSKVGYKILYCGKIGNASTLKVVTNYLASINLFSLGEALMVCKKYGLDLKTAYQGIKISSGNSFVHETESKVILSGSYNVNFTMDLVCKDLKLFNKLTKNYKIKTRMSKILLKIFKEGKKIYGEREWSTKIVKLIENDCKTNLRAKGFPLILKDKEPKKPGLEIKFSE